MKELTEPQIRGISNRSDGLIAAARAAEHAAALDWLEAQINTHGAIHLHDGAHPHGHGVGLRPGHMTRSLREAIDQARKNTSL